MFEVVTVGALAAFLGAVGNGAAGELGKRLVVSTGAQVRRTLGWGAPLPATEEEREDLARRVHTQLIGDRRQADEWALLLRSLPPDAVELRPGAGLPPATRHFTDRESVVRQLQREARRAAGGRPRVALLHGPPGIGTSAVALHWGAGQAGRFPDGQFYVDLRDGAGEHRVAPAAVLARLLERMGVAPDRMPPTGAGREELYRSLTAGRRALVVIDHACTAAQVRALIPATPEVFLLVVSSGPAFALEAERVTVPPLTDRDAVRLLRRVAGQERVTRAKRDMPALLGHCAGNAYALKVAATRLLTGETLPDDAEETMEHPVRGLVQTASRRLRPGTARLCRLVCLGDWPAIDAGLAGWAAQVAPEEAARMLDEAAEAQLAEPTADGRYRFRPEVRRALADAAGPEDSVPACAAAVSRVLQGLLNRALHGAHAALPQSWRVEPAPAEGTAYADEAEGMTALLADSANLLRAVFVAQEYQQTDTALRLARALWPLQLKAGHWDDVLPALRFAAACADQHRPQSRIAGALHFQLAHCLGELRHHDEADGEIEAALACERAVGHLRGEASAVELRGLLRLASWRWEEAFDCFTEAERCYRLITPGQEGAEDLPRALALASRHQGRALRGMREFARSRARLISARDFFAEAGEAYNHARALTDLAETLHDEEDQAGALAAIAEAERLLTPEKATAHLRYLADLRRRCEGAP
ncbi:ATP-binding protein [Streptomyces reniochalinae]|uniref:ATP-binding protein n=1 Tax=Streptomyces reniochalinae TaxID=2250578 RepID=A0A367F637_9ACTN|nr:ATP-binding protein [Streptomyces reniochalinae]RCG25803.1 ATP-binding protein [Streptomyces reniochalinae]